MAFESMGQWSKSNPRGILTGHNTSRSKRVREFFVQEGEGILCPVFDQETWRPAGEEVTSQDSFNLLFLPWWSSFTTSLGLWSHFTQLCAESP